MAPKGFSPDGQLGPLQASARPESPLAPHRHQRTLTRWAHPRGKRSPSNSPALHGRLRREDGLT
eukprot:12612018-Alexandrium_andersonii.AAC.1